MSDEFCAWYSEKSERRRIRFKASVPVIEDQDRVQGAIEDGLEFSFRRVQNTAGFAVFATSQKQEAGMKSDCQGESDQNESEQNRRQASTVNLWDECSNEQAN